MNPPWSNFKTTPEKVHASDLLHRSVGSRQRQDDR